MPLPGPKPKVSVAALLSPTPSPTSDCLHTPCASPQNLPLLCASSSAPSLGHPLLSPGFRPRPHLCPNSGLTGPPSATWLPTSLLQPHGWASAPALPTLPQSPPTQPGFNQPPCSSSVLPREGQGPLSPPQSCPQGPAWGQAHSRHLVANDPVGCGVGGSQWVGRG